MVVSVPTHTLINQVKDLEGQLTTRIDVSYDHQTRYITTGLTTHNSTSSIAT